MKSHLSIFAALLSLGAAQLWAQTAGISSIAIGTASTAGGTANGVAVVTERIGTATNQPGSVGDTLAGIQYVPGQIPLDSSPGSIAFFTLSGAAIPGGAGNPATAFTSFGTLISPTAVTTYLDVASKLTPNSYSALTFAEADLGAGSRDFYMIHHRPGTDYFAQIVPGTGTATLIRDLKPMSWPGPTAGGPANTGTTGYFGLAWATGILSAGAPYLDQSIYYLRSDTSVPSHTIFGVMNPGLTGGDTDTLDLTTAVGSFGVGGYTTLAFSPTVIGNYGSNQFYYLRQDTGPGGTGNTILGRLNPSLIAGTRTISDIANLGGVFTTLTFAADATGPVGAWGTSQFFVSGALVSGSQSISFEAIPNHHIGDVFTITPTASSGLDLDVTVVSGPATVQTTGVDGATPSSLRIFTVTTTGPGVVTLRASQAGRTLPSPPYAANMLQQSFNVGGLAVAPVDFNGDGQSDLLFQNTETGERVIWLMNGTTATTAVSLGTVSTDWWIVGTGDFNGDGQNDLLWQNTLTGERLIWLMNGTTPTGSVSIATVSTDWTIAGTGDFNGDGQTDILWTNTVTGERQIWLMNGTTPVDAVSLGVIPFQWALAGTGDFNGDGQTDLLWDNTLTGDISVWLMNGSTPYNGVSLGNITPQLQISGTGDYNDDGHLDILLTNRFTGERSVWLMNGTTHITTASLVTLPQYWVLFYPVSHRVWADFNGDGKSDLVWQNTVTGESLLYLMDGTAPFTSVSVGPGNPNLQIAATGDFNADGKSDLVWQNLATGDRYIWLMNGATMSSSVDLGIVPLEWSIVGTGDFNEDGNSDLIWKNTATGEYVIWLMSGTMPFQGISLGMIDPDLKLAGTGDFNGDSHTDLLWQNTVTGDHLIWLMHGTTFLSSVSIGTPSTDWSFSGTGDFDGDGQTDLLWTNVATGERVIWLMNGTTPVNGISLGIYPPIWALRN